MAASMEKLFVREFERKNGDILKIYQCEIGDVGCVVWDAALVLSYFLESPYFLELCDGSICGKRAVELGSGTGIVGIQAACLGFDTIVTDLPDFVQLMSVNVEANKHLCRGDLKALPLVWGRADCLLDCPNVLLLADCIYYEEAIEPLVSSINHLANETTLVLCCYEVRTTGNKPELQNRFFQLIRKDFDVSKVPLEKQDSFYQSEDIEIMIFRKKTKTSDVSSNCPSG